MKHWAKDYDECQKCGSTEHKHKGGGLCTTCYYRQYQRPAAAKRARGNIEQERQKMMRAIVDLYAALRVPCPLRYNDNKLTLVVGKATKSHQF